MYKIDKVKNYRQFAEILEKKTGCSIKIKVIDNNGNHVHYQLNDKYDMTIGVLCVDNGFASFAPFETHESVKNEQYINVKYMAQFDDFVKVLSVFREMFIVEVEEEAI